MRDLHQRLHPTLPQLGFEQGFLCLALSHEKQLALRLDGKRSQFRCPAIRVKGGLPSALRFQAAMSELQVYVPIVRLFGQSGSVDPIRPQPEPSRSRNRLASCTRIIVCSASLAAWPYASGAAAALPLQSQATSELQMNVGVIGFFNQRGPVRPNSASSANCPESFSILPY